MITKRTCGNITWVDVESPARNEVRSLIEEYGIHPLVGEELLSPTLRPKVDIYDNFIYLIFVIIFRGLRVRTRHRKGKQRTNGDDR